jgi:excisionase family DNA binding protein
MDTELLTVNEAADLLRLRPSTVRAWTHHRRIPYVKFSRRVFLRRSDVEQLIKNGLVPARRIGNTAKSAGTTSLDSGSQDVH